MSEDSGSRSAVQRCLGIAELVQIIVNHVAEGYRDDVVALSMTNTLFYTAAQNVIWENLSLATLHDLLRCFPEGTWTPNVDKPRSTSFQRIPTRHEWTRFLANAVRVKSFTYERVHSPIGDKWWQVLAGHRPRLDIFPNIRHLEWDNDGMLSPLRFANIFVTDKLQSFSLKHDADDGYEAVISLINSIVGRGCPLREFHLEIIDIEEYSNNVDTAVSSLVSALDLEVYDSNTDAELSLVPRLGEMRTLKTAKVLRIHPEHLPMLVDRVHDLFPVIEVLHLDVDNVDAGGYQDFLKAIASRKLTELTLIRRKDSSQADALALFNALGTQEIATTLRKFAYLPHEDSNIYTEFRVSVRRQQAERRGISPSPWTPRALFPLLHLSHLTHLHITCYDFNIDDHFIMLITQWLRRLESLLLLPGHYSDRQPAATLNSIEYVALRLPNIREAGFPFDVERYSTGSFPSEDQPRNKTCTLLNFANSPLSEERVPFIGAFIRSLFQHPELKVVAFEHECPQDLVYMRTAGNRHRRWWTEVIRQIRRAQVNRNIGEQGI